MSSRSSAAPIPLHSRAEYQHALSFQIHDNHVLLSLSNKQKPCDAEQHGNSGKYGNDPCLGPAAKLKMMVNRRHLEETFSSGLLEISNLNDNGNEPR